MLEMNKLAGQAKSGTINCGLRARLWFLFMSVMFGLTLANSQTPTNQACYIEFFGNGGLYSLNYERRISDNYHARLAVTSWSFGFGEGHHLLFPLMVNYFSTEESISPEFGVGIVPGISDGTSPDYIFAAKEHSKITFISTATIGIRYQPAGLLYRLSYTPLFNIHNKRFASFGGISCGFTF